MPQTLTLDKEVDQYIEKQPSPQKEICLEVRQIIFETFPDIKEKMKWGVPSYGGGLYYFVGLKTHVNLGFAIKGLTPEEIALFDGGGKTMKHLQIRSVNDIDKERIVKLLKMIIKKSVQTH